MDGDRSGGWGMEPRRGPMMLKPTDPRGLIAAVLLRPERSRETWGCSWEWEGMQSEGCGLSYGMRGVCRGWMYVWGKASSVEVAKDIGGGCGHSDGAEYLRCGASGSLGAAMGLD